MNDDMNEQIAIIGMAGRFPGAKDLDEYWNNIANKIESSVRFQKESHQKENFIPYKSTLDDIDKFDAEFFKITPADAQLLDPQQRVFLESCYHALEDAGCIDLPEDMKCSIFAGSSISTYLLNNIYPNKPLLQNRGEAQTLWSNDKDYLATMIAYRLNLKGAAVSVNTACSTSLVAVSQACSSLMNFETDVVLAGGVRIEVTDTPGYHYFEGGIFSSDGHCRAFDKSADGTIFSDGCGVVVLKRLSDAIAAGDNIQAVISGYAVNNDGNDKVGFSSPSLSGQSEVIREAWEFSGVNANQISYIEAHGTGTSVGDPIEIAALQDVFNETTNRKQFCAIGSVKSNIGHCGSAAGIAGLIKVVKALQYHQLPPTINFDEPNPNCHFPESAMYVNDELRPWPQDEVPRTACISSFGIGGTNAHIVLQEYEKHHKDNNEPEIGLLTFSANNAQALNALADSFSGNIDPEPGASNIAYSAAVGRGNYPYRSAALLNVGKDKSISFERIVQENCAVTTKRAVFMFPGQGCQYLGMGYELYQQEPVFKASFEKCNDVVLKLAGIDLRKFILIEQNDSELSEQLNETLYTQPLLFAIEYSLAQLWMSFGVVPTACMGHSLGEITAACVSGLWTLEDALSLVVSRAQLIQETESGLMLSIGADSSKVESYLSDHVSIVAENSCFQTVVAGPTNEIKLIEKRLNQDEITHSLLPLTKAFHSHLVEPVLEKFSLVFEHITFHTPQIDIISNVTGNILQVDELMTSSYWVQHMRMPVKFSTSVKTMEREFLGCLYIEMGPAAVLRQLCIQNDVSPEQVFAQQSYGQVESKVQYSTFLSCLGKVWAYGLSVDWHKFYENKDVRRVSLPGYPFSKTKHWIEATQVDSNDNSTDTAFLIPRWQQSFNSVMPINMQSKNYLLFSATEPMHSGLLTRLINQGHNVVVVEQGELFERRENNYRIRSRFPNDYYRLFDELAANDFAIDQIIMAWPISIGIDSVARSESEQLENILLDMMYLANTCQQFEFHKITDIRVLIANTFRLGEQGNISPVNAALAGAVLVLDDEHVELSCQCIDIMSYSEDCNNLENLSALIQELNTPVNERKVAIRYGQRWIESLQAIKPREQTLNTEINDGDHFLVTGALGEIGGKLVNWLMSQARINLTLVLKDDFPLQSTWDDLLNSISTDQLMKDKLTRLIDWREQALGLNLINVSVENLKSLPAEIACVLTEKPLKGIFHLAGRTSREMVIDKLEHKLISNLTAKVAGTTNVLALAQQHSASFVVLFSSISALLGGVGQYEYAAANAFMDAKAQQNSSGEYKLISINWDRWQGNAIDNNDDSSFLAGLKQSSLFNLNEMEAFHCLEQILATGLIDFSRVVVTKRPLINESISKQSSVKSSREVALIDVDVHSDEAFSDEHQFSTDIERELANIWKSLMQLSHVSSRDNFLTLGGDSLLALRLKAEVKKLFKVDLEPKALFQNAFLDEMASVIESLITDNSMLEETEEFEF